MKKCTWFILITAILAALLPGHGNKLMTAEETVQKYFDYWNEKDEQGMRSLEYEKIPQGERQLDLLNSVKLDNCIERENIDKSDWCQPWYPDPYDFTCVDTTFIVNAKEGSVFSSGTYYYNFWLVRESKDLDWIIVSFGMC